MKPLTNQPQEVDAAAVGGRKMQLPGEISIAFDKQRRSQQKPYYPTQTSRHRMDKDGGLRIGEGLNIKLFQML